MGEHDHVAAVNGGRVGLIIRRMEHDDAARLQEGFAAMGWSKPAGYFESCSEAQDSGHMEVWIAEVESQYAGHLKLAWHSGSAQNETPEIQDLAVLPEYRRRGIAGALLDRAEVSAFERSDIVRIAVGLHPGYNAAQRLYVLRGYVPDGRGVTYRNQPVAEGAKVRMDDDLVLHLETCRSRGSDLDAMNESGE